MGIKEAGSVDMDASSMNTTGKSITWRAADAEVMEVVQTWTDEAISSAHWAEGLVTHNIRTWDNLVQHSLLESISLSSTNINSLLQWSLRQGSH